MGEGGVLQVCAQRKAAVFKLLFKTLFLWNFLIFSKTLNRFFFRNGYLKYEVK